MDDKKITLNNNDIKKAAGLFQLTYPYEISISSHRESLRTQNKRHTFYFNSIEAYSLFETMSKAKLNEEVKADLFNNDSKDDTVLKDAFDTLTTPLLMVWIYDTMSIYLSNEQMKRELYELEKAYGAFCKSNREGSGSLVAAAYSVLLAHGAISLGDQVCESFAKVQTLVDCVDRFTREKPSLKVLCNFFNSLESPIVASVSADSTINLARK